MKRAWLGALCLLAHAAYGQTIYPPPGVPASGGTFTGAVNFSGTAGIGSTVLQWGVAPSSAGSPTTVGANYAAGDSITLACTGSCKQTVAATLGVTDSQATSATVHAGGTGGTNGACTVTGTTGVGTPAQFTGTVVGNALTGPLTVAVAGDYTTNPTNIANEPVTGCSLTGAAVNMTTTMLLYAVQTTGNFTVPPTNPIAQASTTGTGTGGTFSLVFGQLAAGVGDPSLKPGGGNTSLGFNANSSVTNGSEDTAFGAYANLDVSSGSFNTAVGHRAIGLETTGSSLTAVGTDCMRDTTGSSNMVCMGAGALRDGANQNNIVAIGQSAMAGQASSSGGQDVAVGTAALGGTARTSASYDVAIGSFNSNVITSGSYNVVIGAQGAQHLTSGSDNILIGTNVAQTNLTTGSDNIYICTSGTNASNFCDPGNNSDTFLLQGNSATPFMKSTGIGTPSTSLTTIQGDLTVGSGANLGSLSVTTGFFHFPFTNATSGAGGVPTGTPGTINGNACVWNDVTFVLNCYSASAAAWKHVAFSASAG